VRCGSAACQSASLKTDLLSLYSSSSAPFDSFSRVQLHEEDYPQMMPTFTIIRMKNKEMAQHYGTNEKSSLLLGLGVLCRGLRDLPVIETQTERGEERNVPYAHSSSSYITGRRQVYSAPSRRRRRTYLDFGFSPSPPPYAASPAIPLDRGLPCLLGVYNLSSNLFFSFSPEGGAAKVLSAPSHSLCRPRGKRETRKHGGTPNTDIEGSSHFDGGEKREENEEKIVKPL
jgi:hypothetical protein